MAMTSEPELARILEDVPTLRQGEASECCEPACGPDTCGSEQVVQIELAQPEAKAQSASCCDPECGPGCPCS